LVDFCRGSEEPWLTAENLRFAADGLSANVGRRLPKAGREACRPASGASLARLSSHRPAGSVAAIRPAGRGAYRSLGDPEGTLALWSGWLGFDLAPYSLDDPLEIVPSEAMKSLGETFGDGTWTIRDVVDRLAIRTDGPTAVGTGAEVADRIQEFVAATDSDGLNLWHVIAPGSRYRALAAQSR
jgi:alkanesulfonate monooxygenase SsuD/methylene tetrahydromethanopterin reductase-like flavin-dependent oxidoreductase (luciferase family)